jgi:hypothetical protein
MVNGNAGVKDNVFIPEGVKNRRSHPVGAEKEENHDEKHDLIFFLESRLMSLSLDFKG